MVIKKLTLGFMKTNCYFVINNNECLIIDPACDTENIINFAKKNNLIVKAILLTHGHFDHVGACKDLQKIGIKTYVSKIEAKNLIENPNLLGLRQSTFFEPDFLLEDGEELKVIGLKIKCLLTSGHTEGSMSFLIENNLFCGDTIFAGGSYGRTDLFSGDFDKIKNSIKNIIFSLDENVKLFPGHGKESDIKTEKHLLTDF